MQNNNANRLNGYKVLKENKNNNTRNFKEISKNFDIKN